MEKYNVYIRVKKAFIDYKIARHRFLLNKVELLKCTKAELNLLVKLNRVQILGTKKPSNNKKRINFYMPTVYRTGVYQKTYNLISYIKNDYDIVVLYDKITSVENFLELSKLVTVRKIRREEASETCVFCSLVGKSDDKLIANKYIQDINCCMIEENDPDAKFRPQCQTFIAVSKEAARQYKEAFGVEPIVIENPLNPAIDTLANEEVKLEKHKLVLVTASRITALKGMYRMKQLAEYLYKNNVDFIWYILGDKPSNAPDIINAIYVGFKLNPFPYIKQATYLVQLSLYESDCLAVREALHLQTPVIVTNWLGVEDKVKEGVNGYILDMQLSNIDLKKINKVPKIKSLPIDGYLKWYKEL